jgi:hypothetical protein
MFAVITTATLIPSIMSSSLCSTTMITRSKPYLSSLRRNLATTKTILMIFQKRMEFCSIKKTHPLLTTLRMKRSYKSITQVRSTQSLKWTRVWSLSSKGSSVPMSSRAVWRLIRVQINKLPVPRGIKNRVRRSRISMAVIESQPMYS